MTRQARFRFFTAAALALWVCVLPFIGPSHAFLHAGHDHDDHDVEATQECTACGSHAEGPIAYGLCEIPDCPDPTHHHHGEHHGDEHELTCVTCSATVLAAAPFAVPAPPEAAPDSPTPFHSQPAAFEFAGQTRARAPPALRS